MTPRESRAAALVLAGAIHAAIRNAGLSQRVVAETIGVTPQYLSDMLKGRRFFTPAALDALHGATGTSTPIHNWRILAVRARGWDIAS